MNNSRVATIHKSKLRIAGFSLVLASVLTTGYIAALLAIVPHQPGSARTDATLGSITQSTGPDLTVATSSNRDTTKTQRSTSKKSDGTSFTASSEVQSGSLSTQPVSDEKNVTTQPNRSGSASNIPRTNTSSPTTPSAGTSNTSNSATENKSLLNNDVIRVNDNGIGLLGLNIKL